MLSSISKMLNEHFNKSLIHFTELEGGWSAKAYKTETNDGIFFSESIR